MKELILTITEIAQKMGVSENTIRSAERKAMAISAYKRAYEVSSSGSKKRVYTENDITALIPFIKKLNQSEKKDGAKLKDQKAWRTLKNLKDFYKSELSKNKKEDQTTFYREHCRMALKEIEKREVICNEKRY